MIDNKKKQIITDYSKTAEIYNKRYESIQKEKYKAFFSKIKALKPNDLVLDLGCGTGLFCKFLREKNIQTKLIGIDIVLKMVEQSVKEGELSAVADAEELPFKSNSFDAIFSFTALQNLPNPKQALAEIKRIVKPNGLIVLTFLKKLSSEITLEIEKTFEIQEKFECGEDVCFILN